MHTLQIEAVRAHSQNNNLVESEILTFSSFNFSEIHNKRGEIERGNE